MKTCTNKECKQINPQSLDNFYYRPNRKCKTFSRCKNCYCEASRKYGKIYQKINSKNITLKKKIRRDTNIECRLRHNIRARFHAALKGNFKTGSAIKDLGCSIDDLKFWLEFWFEEGMTWENYGKQPYCWSIDHIIPISKIDLNNKY